MPQQTENFAERWNVIANPGAEHTEQAFTDFIRGCGQGRKVLNCAVPLRGLSTYRFPDARWVDRRRLYHHLHHWQFP